MVPSFLRHCCAKSGSTFVLLLFVGVSDIFCSLTIQPGVHRIVSALCDLYLVSAWEVAVKLILFNVTIHCSNKEEPGALVGAHKFSVHCFGYDIPPMVLSNFSLCDHLKVSVTDDDRTVTKSVEHLQSSNNSMAICGMKSSSLTSATTRTAIMSVDLNHNVAKYASGAASQVPTITPHGTATTHPVSQKDEPEIGNVTGIPAHNKHVTTMMSTVDGPNGLADSKTAPGPDGFIDATVTPAAGITVTAIVIMCVAVFFGVLIVVIIVLVMQ